MIIKHEDWGIVITLPNGADVEIHKNNEGILSELTITKNDVSRDISFNNGKILADGKEI